MKTQKTSKIYMTLCDGGYSCMFSLMSWIFCEASSAGIFAIMCSGLLWCFWIDWQFFLSLSAQNMLCFSCDLLDLSAWKALNICTEHSVWHVLITFLHVCTHHKHENLIVWLLAFWWQCSSCSCYWTNTKRCSLLIFCNAIALILPLPTFCDVTHLWNLTQPKACRPNLTSEAVAL